MTHNLETEPELLLERRGALAVLTLNRPRAVNAINLRMLELLHEALDDCEQDASVEAVLIEGAGDRGLCAGGDVVALYRAVTDGQRGAMVEFFRQEYTLNLRLAQYPKPLIAVMDGLVLGGGVGVSAHGSHRVVTERTRIGMPETVIGFSPDVGGLNILARAPKNLGRLMAVTGLHVGGADALAVGLADYYVPSEKLGQLCAALEGIDGPDAIAGVIRDFSADPGPSQLMQNADWIESAFAANSLEEILEAVRSIAEGRQEGNELAGAVVAALLKNGPTGMKVALEAVTRASTQTLAQTLDQDFITTCHALRHPDVCEGIRAQVVDKDRNPNWRPAGLEQVGRESVLAFFEPTEDGQLGLAR